MTALLQSPESEVRGISHDRQTEAVDGSENVAVGLRDKRPLDDCDHPAPRTIGKASTSLGPADSI